MNVVMASVYRYTENVAAEAGSIVVIVLHKYSASVLKMRSAC
jgi:hypothetical protein